MADEIKNHTHKLELPNHTHSVSIPEDLAVNSVSTNIDESTSTDGSQNTDEQKGGGATTIPYDRFKQKVDEANALKEKLAEFESAQAESERKKLEEQNEYKTLYEQALEQADQAKQEALSTKKNALLTRAGYGEKQTNHLLKLVSGDTDEEIAESIAELQKAFPLQDDYGDPGAFNGAKAKPETVDAEEVGRTAISKVLHKIKL